MPLGKPRTFNKAQQNQLRWNRVLTENPNFDPEMVHVPGDGPLPPPSGIVCIGVRPGKDEPWANPPRPFIGMAGKELDRYLLSVGLRRDDIYVTNLVKTYRMDAEDKPADWEVARDSDILLSELILAGPKIVVLFGQFVTRAFLGDWATMDVVSGVPHCPTPDVCANYGLEDDTILLPIFHPAAGLHNPETQPNIEDGFRRLKKVANGTLRPPMDEYTNTVYTVMDDPDGSMWWHMNQPIAIDTEGWRNDPICLQYSRFEGEGRLIYADNRYALDRFQQWVNLHTSLDGNNGFFLLHNSLHDLEVMDTLGITLPEDKFIDTMVLAYLLCLEPQSLKALAYRHCGMEMMEYDEVVGPASRAKALEYIQTLDQYNWGEAEQYVTIKEEGGKLVPKVHKPHSLNRRITRILSDYVKPESEVDIRKRWGNLVEDNPQLVEKVHDLIGVMPVATLRDVPKPEAVRYACRDADATLRIYPKLMNEIVRMDLLDVMWIDHDIIPMVNRMQHVGVKVNVPHFTEYLAPRMTREMTEIKERIHGVTGAYINPDSSDQCADLLFDQMGLPWTKLTKSKKRPKCDDKVLEGLRGVHPVLTMITDYRERSKIKGSFCGPIVERVRDGRLRCNLRITRVSSGRLAANSPNLLALPVRSELGLEVRKGIVADEGHVLGEHDLDQIEMREMAHQSRDEGMCQIFREGKRDIHRETASLVFGRDPRDIDTFQRMIAKRIGFGIITGITGMGLADQIAMALALLPDEERKRQGVWDENECNRVIEEWLKARPAVRAYMENCRCEARRYGYVRDRWGRIRYLPGVHSPIRHIREEAERQSHSFKISASAQGIMKLAMKLVWSNVIKALWSMSPRVWVEPLLQVHDSLLVEIDETWWPVYDEMTRDCIQRADPSFSLPIKYKGGCGLSWGALEK